MSGTFVIGVAGYRANPARIESSGDIKAGEFARLFEGRAGVRRGRMRRQAIAIGAGCHAEGAAEMAAEMALVREAAFAGDIGDLPAGAQPIPCQIQALDQSKGMGWHANEALELAAERLAPETVLPRQQRNGRAAQGCASPLPCGSRGAGMIGGAWLALQPGREAHNVEIRQLFLLDL